MSRAKSYLEKGQFSIGEIADFLGYSDMSVFGKVFKKTYGYCPSRYRKDDWIHLFLISEWDHENWLDQIW